MSEWKTYTLGKDVVTKLGDGLHGTPKYDDNGEYYFINGSNLVDGKIVINSNTKKVTEEEFVKYKKDLSDKTILLGINGTIGNVALYNNEMCILGKSAAYLNINDDFDKQFIRYVLTNDHFQNYIKNNASGTTIKNVGLGLLRDYQFLAPKDKTEQTQIAQILTSLDDKIELNLQMNQTLEAMAQAIFKEWFVDFNFPGFHGEFVDGLPKGWKMGKLNDISSNFDNKRVPLSSMQRKDKQGIYPYYGAATIFDYIDEYIFDGTYLLMGEDGTVQTDEGFPLLQYVWGKFWVNNHTHVLQGKSPFTTEYLYLLLSKTNITHLITGAVQPKINQGNMNKIECVLPTKQILIDFQKVIEPIFEKIKSNKIQIQTLTQTRDSLLPKLMSGKIKIKE